MPWRIEPWSSSQAESTCALALATISCGARRKRSFRRAARLDALTSSSQRIPSNPIGSTYTKSGNPRRPYCVSEATAPVKTYLPASCAPACLSTSFHLATLASASGHRRPARRCSKVGGTRSHLGPDAMPWIASQIPEAQLAMIDARHFVHLENPDPFNSAVRGFLERLETTSQRVSIALWYRLALTLGGQSDPIDGGDDIRS